MTQEQKRKTQGDKERMKLRDIIFKKSAIRQCELADRLGISRQAVNENLCRELLSCQVGTVCRYAAAAGVKFDIKKAFG